MIDILMTVYNGEQYVVPQIESILNQTDSNWKLFIQDDCSTDRTVELIEPYVRRYPERITLLRNEKNSGSAQKNFFSMLPLVEHSYCMFCDHDDVWMRRWVGVTVGSGRAGVRVPARSQGAQAGGCGGTRAPPAPAPARGFFIF